MRYARLASVICASALCLGIFACNKEERAKELWQQAQDRATTEKPEAIRLAEVYWFTVNMTAG
jgi:hypothetical protein